MQLYVLILNKTELMPKLVSSLMKAGIHGATIYDSMGAVQYMGHDDVEPPPMFGSLRKYIHPDNENNKTLLVLVKDREVEVVKTVVDIVTGGLSKPDIGIAFTIPVSFVEGIDSDI